MAGGSGSVHYPWGIPQSLGVPAGESLRVAPFLPPDRWPPDGRSCDTVGGTQAPGSAGSGSIMPRGLKQVNPSL